MQVSSLSVCMYMFYQVWMCAASSSGTISPNVEFTVKDFRDSSIPQNKQWLSLYARLGVLPSKLFQGSRMEVCSTTWLLYTIVISYDDR
ncbi:hypothetical protein Pfo_017982 [Paulownia fortunei]|nr:hypothetical protein Pfo_017982 [Paulownia fortunei]